MKNGIFFMLIVLVLFSLHACDKKADSGKVIEPKPATEPAEFFNAKGIIKQNCISCHTEQGTPENRVAPPFFAVKKHYLNETSDEETFVKAMKDFLTEPSIEKSKMPGAVEKFGLMPVLGLDVEDLDIVARYLYNTDLNKPYWYEAHVQAEQAAGNGNIDYLKAGKKTALASKAVLSKNLMEAIQTKGTAEAVSFCNSRAISLTDSMAMALNTRVRRVSDKHRNPANQANEKELAYINEAKAQLAKGATVEPLLFEEGNQMAGYYPITTNQMCLQCHGTPEKEIKPETLDVLKSLYPDDQATGYKVNELRGIWIVEMDKK